MTIRYEKGLFRPSNLFAIRGSVFRYSLPPALICGIFGFVLKWSFPKTTVVDAGTSTGIGDGLLRDILSNNIGFTAYSVLLSFLISFRTAKAYDRFWNGANYIKKMQAEFFVTASNLIAFCRHSNDQPQKDTFQHILIRLLSMLHAVSLHQLEFGPDGAQTTPRYRLIDIIGIDNDSLVAVLSEECPVELIVQWIQSLTVDGIKSGVCTIPPPILSRIFQNLSNALTAYYSAYRVTEVPFPFPYVQCTEVLLLIHTIVTPIVIQSFADGPYWAGICSFLAIFLLLSINFVAAELENPFSQTENVLDMMMLQDEFNKRLLLLITPTTSKIPTLSDNSIRDVYRLNEPEAMQSFEDVRFAQKFDALLVIPSTIGGRAKSTRHGGASEQSDTEPAPSSQPQAAAPFSDAEIRKMDEEKGSSHLSGSSTRTASGSPTGTDPHITPQASIPSPGYGPGDVPAASANLGPAASRPAASEQSLSGVAISLLPPTAGVSSQKGNDAFTGMCCYPK